jgi:hypothetical protein
VVNVFISSPSGDDSEALTDQERLGYRGLEDVYRWFSRVFSEEMSERVVGD